MWIQVSFSRYHFNFLPQQTLLFKPFFQEFSRNLFTFKILNLWTRQYINERKTGTNTRVLFALVSKYISCSILVLVGYTDDFKWVRERERCRYIGERNNNNKNFERRNNNNKNHTTGWELCIYGIKIYISSSWKKKIECICQWRDGCWWISQPAWNIYSCCITGVYNAWHSSHLLKIR